MAFLSYRSMFCIVGASVLSSCGGGSSSTPVSVTPPPVVVAPPSNGAPVAVASSPISTITEGGQFTVTGTNSSDPDGDNLTFTWVQIAGPTILPDGTIQTQNLTLSAPDVTQDTALTFELTASDGTTSNTDTVTVTAQPLSAPVIVRPVAPINTDTAILNGITNEGTDQYRVYWADGFSTTANNIIASQIFSDAGTPVESQINGSFDLPQAGSTFSSQINGLFPLSVLENGGVTYAPLIYIFENAVPALGNLVGPFEGNLSPVADPFISVGSDFGFDQTPIGQNSLLSVVSQSSSVSASVNVSVFNPNGDVEDVPPALEDILPAGSDSSLAVPEVSDPTVTAIGDGGYIVGWRREDGSQSPTLRTVEAQIYTSDNALSGQSLLIDPSAGPSFGAAGQLDAATLENGNALMVWIESQNFAPNGDFIDFVLKGRVVSPSGGFLTSEFIVSESVNDQFATTALTLSNGNVLVVWGEEGNTLNARTVSLNGSLISLGTEHELSSNVTTAAYTALQTQTGRVIIGYNALIPDVGVSSEIVSFCPVGCQ